jgi:hypothetical protein
MSALSIACFVLSAIDGKIEQRACIKFCVKLGESTIKTVEVLCEAFGEHSLSWTEVFEWHSLFKAGRVSVEDDKRSGLPNTSKTTETFETSLQRVTKQSICLQTPLGLVMELAKRS